MGEAVRFRRDTDIVREEPLGTRRHPVDEVPPPGRLLAFGLQHVLAMYAGAVAVPLILGQALKLPQRDLVYIINADLFTCGIATLITTIGFWKIGFRLPVIQGAAFAVLTPMILIGQRDGLTGIYGAVLVAGAVGFGFSRYLGRLFGFFPRGFGGSFVLVIGFFLFPVP